MTLDDRELATVLAALRLFQHEPKPLRDAWPHFTDLDSLTDDEIDALCERLNGETET